MFTGMHQIEKTGDKIGRISDNMRRVFFFNFTQNLTLIRIDFLGMNLLQKEYHVRQRFCSFVDMILMIILLPLQLFLASCLRACWILYN